MSSEIDKYKMRSSLILLLMHLWLMITSAISTVLVAVYAPTFVSVSFGLCVGVPMIAAVLWGMYYTKKENDATENNTTPTDLDNSNNSN